MEGAYNHTDAGERGTAYSAGCPGGSATPGHHQPTQPLPLTLRAGLGPNLGSDSDHQWVSRAHSGPHLLKVMSAPIPCSPEGADGAPSFHLLELWHQRQACIGFSKELTQKQKNPESWPFVEFFTPRPPTTQPPLQARWTPLVGSWPCRCGLCGCRQTANSSRL